MVRHASRVALAVAAVCAIGACAQTAEREARTTAAPSSAKPAASLQIKEFRVPSGSHPHDVAPATDGGVWYTAQSAGKLGYLDPSDGSIKEVPLGSGSAPHGVIVGPDGAAWVTDAGQNAIVRVDQRTHAVRVFRLPSDFPGVRLNTAAFDRSGVLWFTGQAGFYGKLDPKEGTVRVFAAPGGPGPYGITSTPNGDVYYASLAGSHLGRIDTKTSRVTRFDPPTKDQGARRAWSDSRGRVWITEWSAAKIAAYEPNANRWREWRLPGANPQPYAVFVDDDDIVWVSDFGANAIVRFDPTTERFTSLRLPSSPGYVRQLLGRPGEVWGAESAADALVIVRTR